MKKICVVTGARSEYGLLQRLMGFVKDSDSLELQVVVTGMHLSPEFGHTVDEIESDGFTIADRLEILLSSDTAVGTTKAMGLALLSLSETFARLRPDIVVLLGDRFETFAAATAAFTARIPVAHLHGGEVTEGAVDEAFRHAISKMAHVHFVAAEPYRRRVIQLGEHPSTVHNVGAFGVDRVLHASLMGRAGVEAALGVRLLPRNYLVSFHPVTLAPNAGLNQLTELLAALEDEDVGLIFTLPNADFGGREIVRLLREFCSARTNAWCFSSLGHPLYESCLSICDVIVGNSSSGIIEAPAVGTPTVNIGERQRGRLRAASIIDCEPYRGHIREALRVAGSRGFRDQLGAAPPPYGRGGASERVLQWLEAAQLDTLHKAFWDLNQKNFEGE